MSPACKAPLASDTAMSPQVRITIATWDQLRYIYSLASQRSIF